MSKNYTVQIDGTQTATRSAKAAAIKVAQAAIAAREGYRAEVLTPAGTVVFTVARRKITKVTKPFTKVVTLPEDLAALVPAGYAAAYARLRNGAVVLRREEDIEDDDSRYAVLSVAAKAIAGYAETTRAAGQIMKALGKARKVAVAA